MSRKCEECCVVLTKISQHRFCSRNCLAIGLSKSHKGKHFSKKSEFKKGIVPWSKSQKGVHLSPGSEWKKGMIPWNKGQKGYKAGPLNNRWKGGVTKDNTKFRETNEYKLWRSSVYKRDNYTCKICERYSGRLNSHHIKPFSSHPDLRLSLDNGITLCFYDHKKYHLVTKVRNRFNHAIAFG